MNNQGILEKAYKKAMENGWFNNQQVYEFSPSIEFGMLKYKTPFIFNHDFAKALWGEQTTKIDTSGDYIPSGLEVIDNKGWEHHLQNMVLADDPIKYLGDNI